MDIGFEASGSVLCFVTKVIQKSFLGRVLDFYSCCFQMSFLQYKRAPLFVYLRSA